MTARRRDASVPVVQEAASITVSRPLSPFQRLSALCDPGSLHPIRSDIRSRTIGDPRPGDGVVGAAGMIAGRPVFCFAQDATFLGGSLGEAHADTVVRV